MPRHLDPAREQSRRKALLKQIAQAVLEASTVTTSLEHILQQVAELSCAENCCISL